MRNPTAARSWIAPCALALGVLLFFHPVVRGRGLLYFRDVSLNHYPTRLYTTPILRSGHVPLWNPYLSGGMPLAANPNNLIFHPITLLFLVLPTPIAFHLSILLQYLLAGWGLYRWAKEIGLEEKACLAGGLIYAFSGGMASCGTFHNLLSSWAWVPLALFAFCRHLRSRSRWALAGASACLAVQLLAGDPLAAATTIFLCTVEAFSGAKPVAESSARRRIAGLGILAVAGAGLALVQILPARELLAASGRAAGIAYRDASEWPLPAARLLEWVVPSLYGNVTALRPESYWGGMLFTKGYQFLLTVYVGIIPLLLAVAALARGPRRRGAAYWIAILAAVVVALGDRTPLYSFLYQHVPLFASLRYPSRFLLPTFVMLSILSAVGLDQLIRELGEGRLGRAARIVLGGCIVGAMPALVLALSPSLTERLVTNLLGVPVSVGKAVLEAIAAKLAGRFFHCAALAAILAVLVLAARRRRGAWALPVALLVAVIGADLIASNFHVNPVVRASFYQEKPAVEDVPGWGESGPRVYSEMRPPGLAVWAHADSAEWGYRWNRLTVRVCAGLPHRIPLAYHLAIDLLSPPLENDLALRMPSLEPEKVRRLCDLASVGVLLAYRDLPDPGLEWVSSITDRTSIPLRLYRSRNPLPRAYLVGGARPEEGGALAALTDPDFDPAAEVYLAGKREREGTPGPAGTVRIAESLPERLVVELSAQRPGWLVVTDNDYPGWVARMDGGRVPIEMANFLFRAVQVPAGEHRITFDYRPASLLFGALGTIATLISLGVWILLKPRKSAS